MTYCMFTQALYDVPFRVQEAFEALISGYLPVVATKGRVFFTLHRQEPVFCKINRPIAYIFIFSLANIQSNGIHIGTNYLKNV
jgi:hypothetical protein